MKRFIYAILMLLTACTQPVLTPTPSATSTLEPSPSPSITPSETATFTPSATLTPIITRTPAPTPTADTITFSYPVTITVMPWSTETASRLIQCLLAHYDFDWKPGTIIVFRRDKAGYFNCVKGD